VCVCVCVRARACMYAGIMECVASAGAVHNAVAHAHVSSRNTEVHEFSRTTRIRISSPVQKKKIQFTTTPIRAGVRQFAALVLLHLLLQITESWKGKLGGLFL
jgi:hypothetical protein